MTKLLSALLIALPITASAGFDTVKPKGKPGTQYPVIAAQEMTCNQTKAYIQKYGFYWSGALQMSQPVPIYGFIGWWDKEPACKGRNRIQPHFRGDVKDAAQQPYGVCVLGYDCVPL